MSRKHSEDERVQKEFIKKCCKEIIQEYPELTCDLGDFDKISSGTGHDGKYISRDGVLTPVGIKRSHINDTKALDGVVYFTNIKNGRHLDVYFFCKYTVGRGGSQDNIPLEVENAKVCIENNTDKNVVLAFMLEGSYWTDNIIKEFNFDNKKTFHVTKENIKEKLINIFNNPNTLNIMTRLKNESGKRNADGSVRFSAHPAKKPFEGVMEMVHNMLTYGKSKGRIEIRNCGKGLCNYYFYNDGTTKNLPTYERLKEIAKMAGKPISSNQGVSLCGVGIEVMGLSSRKYSSSTVLAEIRVVRKKSSYGINLIFDGRNTDIKYEILSEKPTDAMNSFEITFKGCKELNNKEISDLKRKIVDIMPKDGFDIQLITPYENTILSPYDYLYRDELNGSTNYEKHVYHLKSGEEIVLEMSDVSDIIKSRTKDWKEDSRKCAPQLSGGLVRFDGIGTICRGYDGWKVFGLGIHPTKHNIRIELSVGKSVFKQIHQESQVKTKTAVTINDLKDDYNVALELYDESGKKFNVSVIKKDIQDFCKKHKTDKNSETNIDYALDTVRSYINKGKFKRSQIEVFKDFLNLVSGRKMQTDTLKEKVINVILSEGMPNNKKEKPSYGRAR